MLVKDMVDLLDATAIYIADEAIYQKDYQKAFATDLMSDALMLLKNETDDVLLITGLANAQALRTAEVLDLETILFVRGKPLDHNILEIAQKQQINLFLTQETMFEACGKLYAGGMQ